jgi:hypothetical protein
MKSYSGSVRLAAVERATASRVAIAAIRLCSPAPGEADPDLARDHVDLLAARSTYRPERRNPPRRSRYPSSTSRRRDRGSFRPGRSLTLPHDIRKTWVRVSTGRDQGVRIHDPRHTHASVGAASGCFPDRWLAGPLSRRHDRAVRPPRRPRAARGRPTFSRSHAH